jgi:hypothetical protein
MAVDQYQTCHQAVPEGVPEIKNTMWHSERPSGEKNPSDLESLGSESLRPFTSFRVTNTLDPRNPSLPCKMHAELGMEVKLQSPF